MFTWYPNPKLFLNRKYFKLIYNPFKKTRLMAIVFYPWTLAAALLDGWVQAFDLSGEMFKRFWFFNGDLGFYPEARLTASFDSVPLFVEKDADDESVIFTQRYENPNKRKA